MNSMWETSYFQQAHVQLAILVHMRFSVIVQFTRRHQWFHVRDVSLQSNSPPGHVVHTLHTLSPNIHACTSHTTLTGLDSFHRVGPVSSLTKSLTRLSQVRSLGRGFCLTVDSENLVTSVTARRYLDGEAPGYLERVYVTPAVSTCSNFRT